MILFAIKSADKGRFTNAIVERESNDSLANIFVNTGPGEIKLTFIPEPLSSFFNDKENPRIANLVAL